VFEVGVNGREKVLEECRRYSGSEEEKRRNYTKE